MKIGKIYYFRFYDHQQIEDVDINDLNKKPCTVELWGKLIDHDMEYWYMVVAECDSGANSIVWQVFKGAIIETKELK